MTTAHISAALGISEGNLWYHFRTKRDLVLALLDALERRVEANLARPLDGPERAAGGFPDYVRQMFRNIWDYRFLYRDRIALLNEDPNSRRRVRRLTSHAHARTRQVLANLVAGGFMRGSEDALDRLAVNSWIVARYWIDYVQSREAVSDVREAHIQAGLLQQWALFQPYLTAKGRRAAARNNADLGGTPRATKG